MQIVTGIAGGVGDGLVDLGHGYIIGNFLGHVHGDSGPAAGRASGVDGEDHNHPPHDRSGQGSDARTLRVGVGPISVHADTIADAGLFAATAAPECEALLHEGGNALHARRFWGGKGGPAPGRGMEEEKPVAWRVPQVLSGHGGQACGDEDCA